VRLSNQPFVKKFQLLDGNAATSDTILSSLETEAMLLDAMRFTFNRDVVEGDDGREYPWWVIKIDLAYRLKFECVNYVNLFNYYVTSVGLINISFEKGYSY